MIEKPRFDLPRCFVINFAHSINILGIPFNFFGLRINSDHIEISMCEIKDETVQITLNKPDS